MAATKMLSLFVLLALSWGAATATIFPQTNPMAAAVAAAINHPCALYCMLQQPITTAQAARFPIASVFSCTFQQQQQCALHCAALSQMIQQITSQVALPCQSSPLAAALATMQQVQYLSNPMLAATMIQSPNLFNPVVAAVLQSSPCLYQLNPVAAAACMQQAPYMSNPILAAAAIQSANLFNPAVAAALQSSCAFNPVVAAMQVQYLFNPMMATTMQQPFALNPFTAASQCC